MLRTARITFRREQIVLATLKRRTKGSAHSVAAYTPSVWCIARAFNYRGRMTIQPSVKRWRAPTPSIDPTFVFITATRSSGESFGRNEFASPRSSYSLLFARAKIRSYILLVIFYLTDVNCICNILELIISRDKKWRFLLKCWSHIL